jgi:hypothetical protein
MTIDLLTASGLTLIGIVGLIVLELIVLESWGDIKKWRAKRWEEKCKRRKIII